MIRPSAGPGESGKTIAPLVSEQPGNTIPPGKGLATGSGSGRASAGFGSLETRDTLFRLLRLGTMPEKGEILKRLATLPVAQRVPALAAQMKLAAAGIELNREEWEELWSILSRRESAPPRSEEDARALLEKNSPVESLNPHIQNNQYFRILREGKKKGHLLVILDEEGSDNLLIRMDTARRRWEFHMVRSSRRERGGTLHVYTDDRALIVNPPFSWEEFRKTMGSYGLKVERKMKSLREEWINTDMSNREPVHMVDIIL